MSTEAKQTRKFIVPIPVSITVAGHTIDLIADVSFTKPRWGDIKDVDLIGLGIKRGNLLTPLRWTDWLAELITEVDDETLLEAVDFGTIDPTWLPK